ncbi:MAG TPA: pyridoxal-dependent decarboxylase [Spirochaetia bacterium]|nr:pyridoxal-dependent decarboxylase [Spirochaetia bacterium]
MSDLSPRLQGVVTELLSTRARLLAAVRALDQAALDRAPASGGWSIGEILHHLQLIERSVTRVAAKQVQHAAESGLGPDPRTDSILHSLDSFDVEDSPRKITAPSGFVPRAGLPRAELLDGLASSREALLAQVQAARRYDLTQLTFPHPVFGKIDLYQWLLYVAQHEIRHLHQIERVLAAGSDPTAAAGPRAGARSSIYDLQDLLGDAASRAAAYLRGLPGRPVAPTEEAVRLIERFDEPLPSSPTDPKEVLRLMDTHGSPATMAMAGPRFFGFVIGGSLPATLAANWLAGAWDQNTAFFWETPSTAMMEQVALKWLVELFGLPPGTAGGFVTGATMANFTALAAARHAVLERAGWNVEADGLIGAPPLTVIVGEEVHSTMLKSLGMLGLGRKRMTRVPVDSQGRMRASELPRITGPAIVCLQAGNVNTGAFDPIGEICDHLSGTGAWVHVDGAFGLWAAAVPSLRGLAAGLEKADSWGTDAHKWLNVPYDSGLAFVKDGAALSAAMAVTADYLPRAGTQRNPSDYTPELSRRARGVEVWAALKSLGRSGVAEMIERNCRQARRFAQGLQAAGHPVLNDVVLNQVVVSFGDEARTRRVIAGIQKEGTCWAGPTVWQGRTAMRISVSGWSTSDDDVEKSLRAILAVAGKD